MKSSIIFSILFILFLQNLKSQDSLYLQNGDQRRHYKTKLFLLEGRPKKGFLADIKDSSVFIANEKSFSHLHEPFNNFHTFKFTGDSSLDKKNYFIIQYSYQFIQSIKIKNQKTKTLSIITGAVVGIVVGALIGYHQGSDKPGLFSVSAGTKAVSLGIVGGGIGALSGLAVGGLLEKKYMINGDFKSLEEMKADLKY